MIFRCNDTLKISVDLNFNLILSKYFICCCYLQQRKKCDSLQYAFLVFHSCLQYEEPSILRRAYGLMCPPAQRPRSRLQPQPQAVNLNYDKSIILMIVLSTPLHRQRLRRVIKTDRETVFSPIAPIEIMI